MFNTLFSPYKLGNTDLRNRFVMSPLTRSRALGNIPNALMAEYYSQRATHAGLIITEGTSPSTNGLGYPRIPGAFSKEQMEGWKLVTNAVHEKGAKIYLQVMHTGRVTHELNLPKGGEIVAPSAIQAKGEMYTDQEGMKENGMPREMTLEDIEKAKDEFVETAKKAIDAGFDGIELHAANGYLLEQFIHPGSNQRNDDYGGTIEKRIRFVVEVAQAVADAIGKEHTGIRLSPYGVFNDMAYYSEIDDTYGTLAQKLQEVGLVYIHIVNHSSMGAPEVSQSVYDAIGTNFSGTIILSGGYDAERAESDLSEKKGDLVAFGRPFLANPDFPVRVQRGAALNEPNPDLFYTPGKEGYTDYPFLDEK